MQDHPLLSLKSIVKKFTVYGTEKTVVNNISLDVKVGEVLALIGKSGTGKSTLLQIAGLLDKPDFGSVIIDGVDCHDKIRDSERTRIRREKLGFIYQFHYLMHEFSVIENVMMPMLIKGIKSEQAKEKAEKLLSTVNLESKTKSRIAEISGGEKQRVAVARGLANSPCLVLADEPTGNLDPENALETFSMLYNYVKSSNSSLFVVTHDTNLAKKADRILKLDGKSITECYLNNP